MTFKTTEEDIEAYDKYMAHQEARKGRKNRGPKTTGYNIHFVNTLSRTVVLRQ